MISLLWPLWSILASPFKSKCQLEAENVALRHQVVVLRRQVRGRVRLSSLDRLVLVQLLLTWILTHRHFARRLQVVILASLENRQNA
jgi:hypothetical protein